MVPAAPSERPAQELQGLLSEHSLEPDSSLAWFSDARLAAIAPEAAVRATLALLAGTIADGVLSALVEGETISLVGVGTPVGSGRIVGHGQDLAARFVSSRYQFEHPALLVGPLAHELLCSPTPRCDAEEKLTHGILAMIHMQLIARNPQLARMGTELSRRVNSIALSLYNSRSPGDPTFRFIAPNGPGTIPGGKASMQSPDFWSIPFLSGYPDAAAMPDEVVSILARLEGDVAAADSTSRYDEATILRIDDSLGLDWLDWEARGRVGRALGAL
jgi:hypothetical protein